MLAKAKMPSAGRSVSRRLRLSLTMTRDIKDELLFVTLFFGFFRLLTSLVTAMVRAALPSPKAGAEVPRATWGPCSLLEVARPSSLLSPPSVE